MVEDHHSVDHAHQHPHDVLDPDDRDAELAADVLQHRGRLVHLGFVEPPEAFVGKQQARIGGQRLGELELFEPGGAEPGHRRRPVRWQPDESERPFRRLGGTRPRMPALAEISGEHDVVEQRQPPERPRDLKGAADPLVDDAMRRSAGDLPPLKADRAGGANVPDSMLKIVLFPDPFGPISPRISPLPTAKETSFTAAKPPNRLTSPVTSSTEARSLHRVR